jgi:hypothetical protein
MSAAAMHAAEMKGILRRLALRDFGQRLSAGSAECHSHLIMHLSLV